MKQTIQIRGFTLIEILTAIAIIGILTAIAIPSYSEYIKRTHLNAAEQSAQHLQILLQDYWEDNETYVAGNDAALKTTLGWHAGDPNITSKVEAGSVGIKTSFIITVTHAEVSSEPIVIRYTR